MNKLVPLVFSIALVLLLGTIHEVSIDSPSRLSDFANQDYEKFHHIEAEKLQKLNDFVKNGVSNLKENQKKVHVRKNHNNTSLSYELLYLKAIEDSLRYAAIIPQNATYQPDVTFVDQKFEWKIGSRVSLKNKLFFDDWSIIGSWMYFHSDNVFVQKSSADFGILAGLTISTIDSFSNSMTDEVKGQWDLRMNVYEIDFKKSFYDKKYGKIGIIASIKGCTIDQLAAATYGDFVIDFPAQNTPHKAIGKSRFYGVGPQGGIDTSLVLPKRFSIFLNGRIAGLYGNFKLKTIYKDMINAPANAKITVDDSLQRFLPTGALQAGISKKFGKKRSCEFAAFWEGQIWWEQMRMNWFSTFVSSQDGSNLTLSGFVFKGQINF